MKKTQIPYSKQSTNLDLIIIWYLLNLVVLAGGHHLMVQKHPVYMKT